MQAALIANSFWLDEERTIFRQLVVGLVDEQVRVTRVVPAGASGPGLSDSPLLGERLTWPESKVALLDQRRIVKLTEQLEQRGIELIHALEGGVWQPAAIIAEALDIPVLLQASSAADLDRAARLSRQLNPSRSIFVATTEPLAKALQERTENQVMVELIQPGVHVGDRNPADRLADQTPCFAVCGDGLMDDAYLALLEGIERVVQTHEALQFFFDGRRSDQHQVWKTARKMDLLPHLSFVPRKVGQREVLLLADGLIHPKAQGRSRGLTLMAMAHGLPVLSPDDPLLDYLIDSRTARVLAEPTAEQWALAIHDLISLPDTARGLGQSAREWVQDHRLASDQIERVLSLYRHATGQPLAQLS